MWSWRVDQGFYFDFTIHSYLVNLPESEHGVFIVSCCDRWILVCSHLLYEHFECNVFPQNHHESFNDFYALFGYGPCEDKLRSPAQVIENPCDSRDHIFKPNILNINLNVCLVDLQAPFMYGLIIRNTSVIILKSIIIVC